MMFIIWAGGGGRWVGVAVIGSPWLRPFPGMGQVMQQRYGNRQSLPLTQVKWNAAPRLENEDYLDANRLRRRLRDWGSISRKAAMNCRGIRWWISGCFAVRFR